MSDNKIREFRKSKKMTQKQLAEAAELHIRRIAALEHGEVLFSNTTVRNAMKIAEALGCKVEDLVKDEVELVNKILAIATNEEISMIKNHCSVYSDISFDIIEKVWRDDEGNLCVKYRGNDWFHYHGINGWW